VRIAAAILLVLPLPGVAADPRLPAILQRVSEEADNFQQRALKVVGQEVLQHKGRQIPSRFRYLTGHVSTDPPKVAYIERRVVSEYGYASFKEAPDALREFRQVVSVDGRRVLDSEKARQSLAINMSSDDDRLRKRMLQDFEKYGMVGAATDFGQMILLFRRRMLAGYEFAVLREASIGADSALVLSYKQKDGPDSLRVYHGREMERQKLEGELWVRSSDYVPLRITMAAQVQEDKRPVRHTATIEYVRSSHGLLLPATVRYRKTIEDELMVENVYQYSGFKMFQVEAEIKFTAEEEPLPPQ